MIEGVNSVLATAPLARGSAEQAGSARSIAANPERVQEVVKAPFVSPYIYVDVNLDKAVLQIRDSETGDVLRQMPSEQQIRAYERAQGSAREAKEAASVPYSETQPQTAQVVQPQTPQAPQANFVAQTPAPTTTPTPFVAEA